VTQKLLMLLMLIMMMMMTHQQPCSMSLSLPLVYKTRPALSLLSSLLLSQVTSPSFCDAAAAAATTS
jgi:hypothetical protein